MAIPEAKVFYVTIYPSLNEININDIIFVKEVNKLNFRDYRYDIEIYNITTHKFHTWRHIEDDPIIEKCKFNSNFFSFFKKNVICF